MTQRPAFDFEISTLRRQEPIDGDPFHTWVVGADNQVLVAFYRDPSGFLLRYPGIADIVVAHGGRRCIAHPCAQGMERLVRHFFISQVRPLMLGLAGWQVYHGSSVEVGGASVAFLGASGLGKSTLAASFSRNGQDYLSDDFICLTRRGNGVHVQEPVEPSLRLRPESVAALVGAQSGTLVGADTLLGKMRIQPSRDFPFCSSARPLRAAFFLGHLGAEAVRITPLAGAEAFVEWVRASFQIDVVAPDALTRQMTRISRLVAEIPCFRLDYPREFARLGEVRAAVLDTIDGIAPLPNAAASG
ncbi:hypothetical protein [Tropicimonas sp. IMCC6043]|uniref:hypothetical protein n=1 Tax=Tropicimonas sp. IMCC6043 TaxID=2510645 RepID=UPI00101D017B|nr:hypothetical protein [Tropicimonas sp. IMCC6043]RYH07500.1 hypothetical protein EU800_20145 [Tropicimonas sp. IMCC6043]